MPWSRSNERFIRRWLVLSDIPLSPLSEGTGGAAASAKEFEQDFLLAEGGEAAMRPAEKKDTLCPMVLPFNGGTWFPGGTSRIYPTAAI